MCPAEANRRDRVLVLAPTEKDAALSRGMLAGAGIDCLTCVSIEELCREIEAGAGAVVLTEEALDPSGSSLLRETLRRRPDDAELPFVVLVPGGPESPAAPRALRVLGNVTLLARPVRVASFLSVVRTALESRRRQYQIQDQMREIQVADQALRRSESRFRAVCEQAAVGIFQVSPDGRIILANERFCELLRYPCEALLGKSALELTHPQDRPAEEREDRRLEAGETTAYRLEKRFLRSDGSSLWVSLSSSAVHGSEGESFSKVCMVEDITDRKMAEASLKEAKEAAEAANRMKDQFLATVSHEIRTPLNAILGWTQILRMGVLKEAERCEALQKIEGSAKAQAQLIDDILDVSRIITGKLRFSREAVRLAPAVGAALDTVRRSAEEKGIEIEAKLDEELAVQGDPGRLQQVVWNLLSNAVKFTSPGGRIQVVLDRHEGRARLRVSDTGKGIHPQFLPKIFERFQQEDSSSTRLYAGLGLGLAIVSHLVEAHGGSIRAESEGPDRGATFTVSIPLLPAGDLPAVESSRPPPKPMRKERPLLDGVRILVVDDEANAREMLRSVLGSCGAEVESAASAAEALEKFRSFDPQVIVSDIAMPLQDGYSLIEKVRSLEQGRRKTAAIALTAYAGEQDRSRALSNGFDLHVAKPTDPLSVAGLVASLVRD